MRTRELFKYLTVMIMALNTSVNAMAQQRNLKIYFNQYVEGAETPTLLVTDDNDDYDIPAGVSVSAEGVVWASGYRIFEGWQSASNDRLLAEYLKDKNGNPDKKESHLKLNFTGFPYEINTIQWNVMNDFLSGSILNFFDNYRVTTKCTPQSGSGFSYTEESWDLNFFTHQFTFNQGDIPWQSGSTLNGLTSFEINETSWIKVGIGPWAIWGKQGELSDKCRTFIQAGWNGKTGSESNITDSDDSKWSFKVKFTLPTIRANCLNAASGNQDANVIKGEAQGTHKIQGYISDHTGNVVPKTDPVNRNDFYYVYSADASKINIGKYTGVINEVYTSGAIPVTVTLMRGRHKAGEEDRFVCSYTYTINALENDPNRPEIAIGFLNSNKGYDITIGDENAQIKGIFIANGDNITLSNDNTGYHFEFSEDSNGEIIDIEHLTGKITAKKEGDVVVSAVLKNGETIASNTYSYTLHIFAPNEGLDWHRVTSYYEANSNDRNWTINNSTYHLDNYASEYTTAYYWKKVGLRTTISMWENGQQNTDDWKQITGFTTISNRTYWRAICQKVGLDVKIPKYSDVQFTYTLTGNATCKEGKNYGFEVKDLNVATSEEADTKIKSFTWNANGTIAASGTDPQTIIYAGTGSNSTNQVAAKTDVSYEKSNKNSADPITETRYLAIMSYLGKNNSNSAIAALGYKGIPTYTYYSTITYYLNDGTETVLHTETFTSSSKTATQKMYQNINLPKRTGYEFLGWSTDPNATTAEYEGKGNFNSYDEENGGGKGPVKLYAVWKITPYIVTLDHNDGTGVKEEVIAYHNQPMPEDETLVAPTRTGYDFNGYSGDGTKYYNANMTSAHVFDKSQNYTIYADWTAHTTLIHFDFQGGNYGATEVTATYGQPMPGIWAPQRDGYTFNGYYDANGYRYYHANLNSARNWNIDEPEVTLYAKWVANTYNIILDKQGGTGGSSKTTATYGQPLPNGLTAPTKNGYIFKGYYNNKNDEYAESTGQDYGGTQFYDENMEGEEPWDNSTSVLYAHWAPKTYLVTLDCKGATLPQGIIAGNSDLAIEQVSDGLIKIRFTYGMSVNYTIDNSKPKKPAYQLLGFYDDNNVLVATVTVDDPKDRHIYLTGAGNYWEQNGEFVKWVHDGDLTLTARYEPKFTVVDGNMIQFGSETKVEVVEPKHDWLMAVVNDLVGAAQEVGTKENPVMVCDLKNSINIWTGGDYDCKEVMESLQDLINENIISPNVLVYFNDNSYNAENCNNAILSNNTCPNLYVTDRYQMKIPYAFDAGKATYERNKDQVGSTDGMWEQSKESIWGTLCLPYPIKNYNTHYIKDEYGNNTTNFDCEVIFYELRNVIDRDGSDNDLMQFYKLPKDEVIPANTPVLYERTRGLGSAVSIEERSAEMQKPSIKVPANPNFEAVTKSYANASVASIHNWEFRGSLKNEKYCGVDFSKTKRDGTEIEVDATGKKAGALPGYIYYFKQNQFTRLANNGRATVYPYRGYFYYNPSAGNTAKNSYSILVVDEDGFATDITENLNGNGEGDGKIYDLNGIRVMNPVKGRLYIVNGKKKVY